MEQNLIGATGRRKEAVARVQLTPGKGTFVINDLPVLDYLQRDMLVSLAQGPLVLTEMLGRVDIVCHTRGGGKAGQADAIRLAISRALTLLNPDLRRPLHANGMMTRDPRSVERKKYGRPKARKRFQYSKR
ncbi:MAG: 30S ribosomal protein S9 [bacterium]|nr:30S ribosomal protein S9 [bacterium]